MPEYERRKRKKNEFSFMDLSRARERWMAEPNKAYLPLLLQFTDNRGVFIAFQVAVIRYHFLDLNFVGK